jgi:hypothetical protein
MNTAIVAIPNRIAKWSLTWALQLIVFSLLALTIPLIASFSALVCLNRSYALPQPVIFDSTLVSWSNGCFLDPVVSDRGCPGVEHEYRI